MNARGDQLHPLAALRRRRAILSSVSSAGLLLAYWIAMALPNYYEASATIFFEPEGAENALPRSDVSPVTPGPTPGRRLLTSRTLSRPRLSRIVEELGLVDRDAPPVVRQQVVAATRSRVEIVAVESGMRAGTTRTALPPDAFRIAFRDRDPEMAARVADRLAEELVQEQIDERLRTRQDRLARIESEQARLHREYGTQRLQVAAFKAENAGRLPEDLAANRRERNDLAGQLRRAQQRRDSARGEQAFWDDQVLAARAAGDPGREGAEAGGGGVALRRAEARRTQAALDTASRVREAERLAAAAAAVEQRLAASPAVAGKLAVLTETTQRTHEALAELAEQKRQLGQQVEVEQSQLAEQFGILEAALAERTPSSPDRFLIILLGGVVGLLGGVALAGAAELRDRSFRVARDVQSAFGIPVLASIPDIVLPADLAARRRRRLRAVLAACLVVAVCISGGALTYVYVNGVPGWAAAAVQRPNGESSMREGRSEERIAASASHCVPRLRPARGVAAAASRAEVRCRTLSAGDRA